MRRKVRLEALFLAVNVILVAGSGCVKKGKEKGEPANDDGGTPDGGGSAEGDDGNGDDAHPKDDFHGIYKLTSQLETPYGSCADADAGPLDEFGNEPLPPFFKLDTEFEISIDPDAEHKYHLWLSGCSDEKTCQGFVSNFYFPEKTDGVWGGQTSGGQGKSYGDPTKCSLSYEERYATLSGTDIRIVSTSFSGDVEPLGNGSCLDEDGVNYYKTYRGAISCTGREIVTGLKLDVPMPED